MSFNKFCQSIFKMYFQQIKNPQKNIIQYSFIFENLLKVIFICNFNFLIFLCLYFQVVNFEERLGRNIDKILNDGIKRKKNFSVFMIEWVDSVDVECSYSC